MSKYFHIPAKGARLHAENFNRSRAITIIRENILKAMGNGHFSTQIADHFFTEYPDMKDQLIELGYKIEPDVGLQVKISW